ncbi:MAG: NRAMP family metal ion transporter [Sulfobacillus acidophilus]|uniref:NRAMP family metal ion transporter n=1 Tax=Sulfobacillus acidophilus TaxID=53633 RepID=A0A2T2WNS4_9FIRM|nr:MAG: NRAMP family metal ion transporter [Sulfobacillus acidophilus]
MAHSDVPDPSSIRLNPHRSRRLLTLLALFGPGIMVMLADTDVGSAITAAQSGVQWGYEMILPQIVLMPILFFVQEMTVRLGVVTQKGHGEAIREYFGLKWGLLSVSALFLASVGALITEFTGIAGVCQLIGIPVAVGVGVAALGLIAIGFSGSYQRVEWIGIALGTLEVAFVVTAFLSHPNLSALEHGLVTVPLFHPGYLFMLAANVGAVIMPWMIFYQQGAVVDKKWGVAHLRAGRWDTGVGAIVTQGIMIAIVITAAATLRTHHITTLNSVAEISRGLGAVLGRVPGTLIWGAGVVGAAFIAALVASVAGAWGISEVLAIKHSLNQRAKDAPWFYVIYSLAHVAGAVLVILSIDLVQLTIDVEVMNAILLPIVVGFLLALESRALPPQFRMQGFYRYLVWGLCGLVMAFGLYTLAAVV